MRKLFDITWPIDGAKYPVKETSGILEVESCSFKHIVYEKSKVAWNSVCVPQLSREVFTP